MAKKTPPALRDVRLVLALDEIAEFHLGDCPAAVDEVAFARAHIARLRRIAHDALHEIIQPNAEEHMRYCALLRSGVPETAP